MATTTNGGVEIHWQEEGTGTPLLLIMGHRYGGGMWYPILPALTARHRVIWFDNRGTGGSGSTATATLADLVADTRAVLDAAGVDQAHVFGVSMGGGIALQLAFDSPERVTSLLLGCTALKSETLGERRRRGSGLIERIPLWMLRPLLKRLMYGPACPPAAAKHDLDVMASIPFSPEGVQAQSIAVQTYDMTADKVAQLQVPSLVLHGTADRVVPLHHADELMAALPDARLVTYEGAGHNFIVAATERAAADTLAFLAEVDGRS